MVGVDSTVYRAHQHAAGSCKRVHGYPTSAFGPPGTVAVAAIRLRLRS